MTHPDIIGKYEVIGTNRKWGLHYSILTDNPLEAVWEANKFKDRKIINHCGEKQFYKEGDKWKIVR